MLCAYITAFYNGFQLKRYRHLCSRGFHILMEIAKYMNELKSFSTGATFSYVKAKYLEFFATSLDEFFKFGFSN
jgi:hypothetical protein